MPTEPETSTVLSQNTVKRLIRDVRSLAKDPLTEHGIHYIHSDTDVLKGQALIIGPKGTPYHLGFYLFDLEYPSDYPHHPPVVKFKTNDGTTRMNPNLYKCGKVCISILNTWRGDAWTGCQTISTVLLTLVSLLNSTPLLNEPGITGDHRDCVPYHQAIQYKNFDTAIYGMLTCSYIQDHFSNFIQHMRNSFTDNYTEIMKQTLQARTTAPDYVSTSIYRMTVTLDYSKLRRNLSTLYKTLVKLK